MELTIKKSSNFFSEHGFFNHQFVNIFYFRCVPTPPPQPVPVDPDAQLKEIIAQTIRDEYFRAGVALNEEELSALVLTQYKRVCERRNRPATPPPQGTECKTSFFIALVSNTL
jgi:hypothetical protein